jgi:hypothetical protein
MGTANCWFYQDGFKNAGIVPPTVLENATIIQQVVLEILE